MFRRLLSFDDAQKIIYKHFKPKPLGVEDVSLLDAYNRVLAEDVISTLDIPPFDRSTVDGYAVSAEDTFGAQENRPVKLKVCGAVNVGEPSKRVIKHGTTAEIVTGAPIPDGADAVVMVEDTERKDDEILVYRAVTGHGNVMKAGSDIPKRKKILSAEQLLGPSEIGVLAALGLAKVKVFAVPRVAVLSTGAEVTEPGKKLPPGKIYDINAYSLNASVRESGGEAVFLGTIPDDASKLLKALKNALESADMVITSGGVSVGPKDLLPRMLDSLGKPGVIVSGIAIKPGKPTTIAIVNGKIIFSLPGHPTSALLIFHLLVRPMLQHMAGLKPKEAFQVDAFAARRMFSARGRRTYVMVALKRDKADQLIAEPVAEGLSGAITTLAGADGFVEILENQQFIDAGEKVTVRLLK